MAPIEISCTFSNGEGIGCAAEAGEPCQWLPPGEFHPERIEYAAAMEQNDKPISDEEFDKAVLADNHF